MKDRTQAKKPDHAHSRTDGKTDEQTRVANPDLGLNHQDEFRIHPITLKVRGGNIVLLQANTGDEVEVSPTRLAGLLVEEYFTKD